MLLLKVVVSVNIVFSSLFPYVNVALFRNNCATHKILQVFFHTYNLHIVTGNVVFHCVLVYLLYSELLNHSS